MQKLKKVAMAILLVLCVGKAMAQQQGIKFFKGTWAQALAQSKKENKMIFFDTYIEGCPPCKELKDSTFPLKKTGDFFNKNFINVSMDLGNGYGVKLSELYHVGMFPTLLFLKPGGFMVKSATGFIQATDLIAMGKVALTQKDSVTMEQKFFEGGYKDTAFLRSYFQYAFQTAPYGTLQQIYQQIIQFAGENALYKKMYWDVIGGAATRTPAALFLVKHHEEFAKLYGEDAVNQKIISMYCNIDYLNIYKDSVLVFKDRMASRKIPMLSFADALVDYFMACKQERFADARAIATTTLNNAKPWQYYEWLKVANWVTPGRMEERQWLYNLLQKAMPSVKDAAQKEQFEKLAADLKEFGPSIIPTPVIYNTNI